MSLKRFRWGPVGKDGAWESVKDDKAVAFEGDLQTVTEEGMEVQYRLTAAVFHIGRNLNGGHYYAQVTGKDSEWYKMDDSVVTAVGRAGTRQKEKEVYILFYVRQDE